MLCKVGFSYKTLLTNSNVVEETRVGNYDS